MALTWRGKIGLAGEQVACDYYRTHGYAILARNWRDGRLGELDLIVKDRTGLIVFVEVKTRSQQGPVSGFVTQGFEAVHWRKRKNIIRLAKVYLSRNESQKTSCRFDVLMVIYQINQPTKTSATLPKPMITQVCEAFSGY